MTGLLPDTEAAARAWARVHPLLAPVVAGRVFFGFPPGDPALPLITVAELADTPDAGPDVTACRLTWQVWGKDKATASDAKRALVAALRGIASDPLTAEVECAYADQITTVWLPDDESRLARYVVDATLVGVRAVVSA